MVPRQQIHYRGPYGELLKNRDGKKCRIGRWNANGDGFLQWEDTSGLDALGEAVMKISTFKTLDFRDYTWELDASRRIRSIKRQC